MLVVSFSQFVHQLHVLIRQVLNYPLLLHPFLLHDLLELTEMVLFCLQNLLHPLFLLLGASDDPCVLLLKVIHLSLVELDLFLMLLVLGYILLELSSVLIQLAHNNWIILMLFDMGAIVCKGIGGRFMLA